MEKHYTDLLESTIKNPIKVAKYRLIKEVNHVNNDIYYWTIDSSGELVDKSMSKDETKAKELFDIICKNDGKLVTRTTIKEYKG